MGEGTVRTGGGALVLAGGGIAGIAWEVGVLLGIEEREPGVAKRMLGAETLLVGTSAGSVVASQLAGGVTLTRLFEQQLTMDPDEFELGAVFDAVEFARTLEKLLEGVTSPEEARRRVGRFALEATTVSAAERRAVLASRLEVHDWPEHRLLVTAVDAASGDLRVFDRSSGVALVDALGASCAVPGIWPTVEIEGRHYTDGGVRTIANADLAAGADRVLVLAPLPEERGPIAIPAEELAALAPAPVRVVFADDESIAAFGPNPLDLATRADSARAGFVQGRRLAPEIARFWANAD